MEILVNGKLEDLTIVDPNMGCEYTQDLIGNHDGFDDFCPDTGLPVMSQESYGWWAHFIAQEDDLAENVAEIKSRLGYDDWDSFFEGFVACGSVDLEEAQSAQIEYLEEYKNNEQK